MKSRFRYDMNIYIEVALYHLYDISSVVYNKEFYLKIIPSTYLKVMYHMITIIQTSSTSI